MASLNIPNDLVIELIDQLPADDKRRALQRLLSDEAWDGLLSYGESKLDEQLRRVGLDRSRMSAEEIETTVSHIADGR